MNNTIKLYNSLKIPKNVFNPVTDITAVGDWNVILSPRGVGKTTNMLLLGMCEHETNGVEIQYIRQYDDMLTPSRLANLFDVILQYGYISKITNGRWTNVKYTRRRWYYCNNDTDGKTIEIDSTPFMACLGINREHELRSSYNAPQGDFIIVDEFMRADKMYLRDEFVLLANLLSTIIRKRTTAKIYLLANLVDITCPYLTEMGIANIVKSMTFGQQKQLTSGETVLNIVLLSPDTKTKNTATKYFAPWVNNKITGITGTRGVWALKMYPHAPHSDFTIIDRAQIQCPDGYICREIRQYKNGLYVMFYPLTQANNDRVTYTTDDSQPFTSLRRYGMGYTTTDRIVIDLIRLKRWYFSDNMTGERIETYLKNVR